MFDPWEQGVEKICRGRMSCHSIDFVVDAATARSATGLVDKLDTSSHRDNEVKIAAWEVLYHLYTPFDSLSK